MRQPMTELPTLVTRRGDLGRTAAGCRHLAQSAGGTAEDYPIVVAPADAEQLRGGCDQHARPAGDRNFANLTRCPVPNPLTVRRKERTHGLVSARNQCRSRSIKRAEIQTAPAFLHG